MFVATYTPMDEHGGVLYSSISPLVEFNLQSGVSGFYVCGTTGEGMSLSTRERKDIATAFIEAVNGRAPVIIQTGHNCLREAAALAEAAAEAGADGISAHCPTYYRVSDVPTAVECSAEVASAAPHLPFYYYHIPPFTGCQIPMRDFCQVAMDRIPNFAGVKFSDTRVDMLRAAMDVCPKSYGFFFGCDEMLLSGLASGVRAAVGSTYNLFAYQFLEVMVAIQQGDYHRAAQRQAYCSSLVAAVARYPFHAAMKALLTRSGIPCGPPRLPMARISDSSTSQLIRDLEQLGFSLSRQS